MRCFIMLVLLLGVSTSSSAESTAAPAFTISDDKGQQISLPRQHSGVDIYFFWASWCPYCKALMPHLQSIQDEFGDRVKIYAFNIRDDKDPRVVLDKSGFDFTLIPEADRLMKLYNVKGTPGLFLVDGEGVIQLNLYRLINDHDRTEDDMSHSQKAARKAPWWAAEVRKAIDQILAKADEKN